MSGTNSIEGKDRHGKVIKPALGPKAYPKLPAFKCPLFIEGRPTPSGVAQIGLRPGQDLP